MEREPVGASAAKRRRTRAFVALLAIPVALIPLGAYLIASDASHGSGLPVAQGASGGAFHPIAGAFVADDTKLAECSGDESCLEQGFGNLAYRSGPRAALRLFSERLESDPVVERDCHRITHFIGSASLERLGGDVARTFALGSPVCVSGYYHGILERAFLGISTRDGLARAARQLCVAEGLRRRGFLDYQCRHGLGHGLMIQTGYDLPLALEICADLGTGWDRKACAGGAFMENVNTRFGYRSQWLDDEDPLDPCGRVAAQDRRSCFLRASWRILVLADNSYQRAAAACGTLGRWSSTCWQGFGRDVAEKARYGAIQTLRLCALAEQGESDCLLGAARTIANASGHAGIGPARTLCLRAPVARRDACFAGVGIVLGMLYATPTARAGACRRFASEHERACARAAEDEVDPSGARSWG